MRATDAQMKTLGQLEREYMAIFGYRIPRMMFLGRDPDTQIRIVRECIEQRSEAPMMRLIPPGSFT